MVEIFVENNKVDVSEDFSTLLSFSIDDVKDFGAKNTTYSKTIVLPGTKRNNVVFGNIFEVTAGSTYDPASKNVNYNFNAAVAAKCYIFQSNFQVFKGILRVMKITIDDGFIEYEVSVFGELGGFVNKIGSKKLEDLDFSEYDANYTLANIVSSWTNYNTGSGVYYPLIDCGNASTDKHDFDYKTFKPAFFAKEYIDKIFAASGYTYDCELFSGTSVAAQRFQRCIIPHNQRYLQGYANDLLDALTVMKYDSKYHSFEDGEDTSLPFFTGHSRKYIFDEYPVALDTINLISGFSYNSTTKKLKYIGSNPITIDINQIVSFFDCSWFYYANYDIKYRNKIELFVNTTVVKKHLFANAIISNDSITNITIQPNDEIYAVATIYNEYRGLIPDPYYAYTWFAIQLYKLTIRSNVPVLVPIILGSLFSANKALPQNVLQKDFLSSIFKLFNLYVFEDPQNDKLLKIEPFVDFYVDAEVIDWSNKLDRSKPISLTPMSELNARFYNFAYKEDGDYYNDTYKKRHKEPYGTYQYDSEFEFAKETTKVELIFSPTPLVGVSGEDKVISAIMKRTGNVVGTGEDITDSNIRILQAKKIDGVSSWDIKDGTTVLGSYTSYPYAGHFDDPDAPANDLNFGVPKELFYELSTGALNVNQFNVYWSSYMSEITDKDSRLFEATFKLDYKDIYNLDFSKLIYIDGQLYRINKISDYNTNIEDTCKISLLKIINRIY